MNAVICGAVLAAISCFLTILTDAMPSVVPPACRAACRHGLRLVLQRRVRNTPQEEVLQMRVVVKVIGHGSRDRLDYQKNPLQWHAQPYAMRKRSRGGRHKTPQEAPRRAFVASKRSPSEH